MVYVSEENKPYFEYVKTLKGVSLSKAIAEGLKLYIEKEIRKNEKTVVN